MFLKISSNQDMFCPFLRVFHAACIVWHESCLLLSNNQDEEFKEE